MGHFLFFFIQIFEIKVNRGHVRDLRREIMIVKAVLLRRQRYYISVESGV